MRQQLDGRPSANGWWRRIWTAFRPVTFSAAALASVTAVLATPNLNPFGGLFRYTLEVFVIAAVAVGAIAAWWAMRRGEEWDADLIQALVGAVGAFTLFGMLHGTPWGPAGIGGDAAFRTEAITRFADTWGNADFTYRGLPAFYAPGFFWIAGRVADIIGLEPWRMVKYATVAAAVVTPLVTYLLWRRIVVARVAALIAIVPLVVQNFYEPYAWIVIFAFVPWWLLTVHRVHRPDLPLPHPLVLGVVGGLLFLTYYYFFAVASLALILHLIVMVLRHEPAWRQLRHPALVFVVVAAVSAVFWVPLAISLLQAGHVDSQLNRYFNAGHGIPQLPFVEFSPTGLISLIGLFYLVLTARDSLSRALLVFLGGAVLWYLIGLPLALADYPLLTFRGKPLIPIVLFTGGVLALVQLGRMALDRLPNRERPRARLALVLAGAVLAFIAARGFMVIVVEHRLIAAAHETALPSGMMPRFAPERTDPPSVSANAIRDVIDGRYAGLDHPVVLSDRADVLAVNPYYGFSQWQVFYAHPAAMFHARIDFLRTLASSESADAFAELSAANPYDAIDAFVLADEGEMLAFRYRDENFPTSTKGGLVEFRRALFDPAAFELVDLGDYVVAVRR